jgi:SWI/SNF-related matrix-associated actin-dependent regulator of chromatin subfamily A3
MARKKRALDVIDLTDENVVAPAPKRPALSPSPLRQRHNESTFARSDATNSFSSASQLSYLSQLPATELDPLDLTQEEDGPPLELYGKLGMMRQALNCIKLLNH